MLNKYEAICKPFMINGKKIYKAWFVEIPNEIGIGQTEQEAVDNLYYNIEEHTSKETYKKEDK